MEDLTMKIGLIELYDLVGDDMGISFLYEERPGVVVTIGFQRDGSESVEDATADEEPKEETKDDEPKLH